MSSSEGRVLDLVGEVTGRRILRKVRVEWLQAPERAECGRLWPTVADIYASLTDGLRLPDVMPAGRWREVDGVLEGCPPQIVEYDGSQHFNRYRSLTLAMYPSDVVLGFPLDAWKRYRGERTPGVSGGWGRTKPPLFPMPGGRHLERAFRDALADLLPAMHAYGPTVRVGDFEVRSWIHGSDARVRIQRLLTERLAP